MINSNCIKGIGSNTTHKNVLLEAQKGVSEVRTSRISENPKVEEVPEEWCSLGLWVREEEKEAPHPLHAARELWSLSRLY